MIWGHNISEHIAKASKQIAADQSTQSMENGGGVKNPETINFNPAKCKLSQDLPEPQTNWASTTKPSPSQLMNSIDQVPPY